MGVGVDVPSISTLKEGNKVFGFITIEGLTLECNIDTLEVQA